MFYVWSGWCLFMIVLATVGWAVRNVIVGRTVTERELAFRNMVVGVWIAWFLLKSLHVL
ncbi:MAG: hypothetical protein ACPLTR_01945 [Thermacetogeniaceae bacterium]